MAGVRIVSQVTLACTTVGAPDRRRCSCMLPSLSDVGIVDKEGTNGHG
jgi:hypothetical protein